MIRVGLLYDSISNNTGDKAVGVSMKEFCERNGFEYEIVNPFDVKPERYSTLIIGGGQLLRNKGDNYYDNFIIENNKQNIILNAVGVYSDNPGQFKYLNDYRYATVRSSTDKNKLANGVDQENINVVPCTTMALEGEPNGVPDIPNKSVGIHLMSETLRKCPELPLAWSSVSKNRVFIPFTQYTRDHSLMQHVAAKNDLILPDNLSPRQLHHVIGQMDLVIVSSLHATIFAYSQKIPFLSMYQEKVKDFLKDRNLEQLMFNSTEELIEKVNSLDFASLGISEKVEADKKATHSHLSKIKEIIIENEKYQPDRSKMKSVTFRQKHEAEKPQLEAQIIKRDELVATYASRLNTELQNNQYKTLYKKLSKARSEVSLLNNELAQIHSSKGWRAVMLIRTIAQPIKRRLPRFVKSAMRGTYRVLKGAYSHIPFVDKTKNFLQVEIKRREINTEREEEYLTWYLKNKPDELLLQKQEEDSADLKKRPLISLIMPTYNTDIQHLRECIESVQAQTYDNWELCIADDASTDQEVKSVIKDYAKHDERIKHVFRKKNGHICEASNSALKIANGEYISLLDHDDFLWPNALFEVASLINQNPDADLIYTDEDKIEQDGITHSEPFLKPDWSPDYLRAINYITHFTTIRRNLAEKVGCFRTGYEGAQDWDLILRVSRETDQIHHIPKILYSWRKSETSTAQAASSKNYAYENQELVLKDDLDSRGYSGEVTPSKYPGYWRVKYDIDDNPLVSVVIPTKDRYEYIKTCLNSLKKTTYKNLEVIIVDTGSEDPRVWKLYERFVKRNNAKVVEWKDKFNFASVCNFGAKEADGQYLLFLNNDTEVITPDWVEGLLEYAQREETGAVGCKLLYPDGRIQHAGIILGVGGSGDTPGVAGHLFQLYNDNPMEDPMQNLYIGGTRNFSAVTAACLLVERNKFEEVEGFDPRFQIAFNDVDFCLKLLDKGWNNVYTPHVKLYHHESISVGRPGSKDRDTDLFDKEIELMGERWSWEFINNDPYYHPLFKNDAANVRIDIE